MFLILKYNSDKGCVSVGIISLLYGAMKATDRDASFNEQKQGYEDNIAVLEKQIQILQEQFGVISKQHEDHLNFQRAHYELELKEKDKQITNEIRVGDNDLKRVLEDYNGKLKIAEMENHQYKKEILLLSDRNRELIKSTQVAQEEVSIAQEVKSQEEELNSLRKENERLGFLNENALNEIHKLREVLRAFDKKKVQIENTLELKLDEEREKNTEFLVKNDVLNKQLENIIVHHEENTAAPNVSEGPVRQEDRQHLQVPNFIENSVKEELTLINDMSTKKIVEQQTIFNEDAISQFEEMEENLPEEVVASLNNVLDSFYDDIELKQPKQAKLLSPFFFERKDMFEFKYLEQTVREILSKIPKDLPSRYKVAEFLEPGWHKYTVEQIQQEHDKIEPLKEQANRPYFGRMDIYTGSTGGNTFYVGNKSMGKNIISWKTEAASIYYEKNIGTQVNHHTMGSVRLDYLRQIDIDNGRIKQLHRPMEHKDSIDFSLQHALQSKRGKDMQVIIATIQKEQNELIRMPIQSPIIVQGSAGSGKSVIALHRLSYLLYKHKNLKENSVAIFGPNKLFLDHIRKVLPELGNYKTIQTTFKEYAIVQLNLKKQLFPRFSESNRLAVVRLKGSLDYKTYIEYYTNQILNNVKPWISTFTYKDDDVEIFIDAIEVAFYYEGLNLPYINRKNEMVNWLSKQVNQNLQILKNREKEINDLIQRYTNKSLDEIHNLPNFAMVKELDENMFGKDILNQLHSLKAIFVEYKEFEKSKYLGVYVKEMKQNLDKRKKKTEIAIESVINEHIKQLEVSIDLLLEGQLSDSLQTIIDSWWKDENKRAEQVFISEHLQTVMDKEEKVISSIKNELERPKMLLEKEIARSLFKRQKHGALEEEYKMEAKNKIKSFMLYEAEKSWYDGVSNMLQRTLKIKLHFNTHHPKPIARNFQSSVNEIQHTIESFVNLRLNLSVTDLLQDILQDTFELHQNAPMDVSAIHEAYEKTKKRGKLSWLQYEDLPALLHVEMLMKGKAYNPPLSYLILDEAQDYMPYEIFIMSRLTLSNGLMLIGDLGQNLNEASEVVNWKSYEDFLKSPSYFELQATYRSTKQIVDVSNQIIRNFSEGKYNLSEQTYREGLDVQWSLTTKALLAKQIQLLINDIEERSENYESIAIITKTLEEAKYLRLNLAIGLEADIQTEENLVNSKFIITTPMDSKGLEFDCVIIADLSRYDSTDYNRKLAYVATSRALHELHIFHTESVEHFMN